MGQLIVIIDKLTNKPPPIDPINSLHNAKNIMERRQEYTLMNINKMTKNILKIAKIDKSCKY